MDPSLTQVIAAEIGALTTEFVKVDEERDVRIRFFTPKREIDACGHVTVAAAAALVGRHRDLESPRSGELGGPR